MAIRVFLADDHAVVRDGLRLMLETHDDMQVVGEAADGREAVEGVAEMQPDVVVMDISMPELNGVDATRELQELAPDVRVLILSMHGTSEHVRRALDAGAVGYVRKESAGGEIIDAVRTVAGGQRYLSPAVRDALGNEDPQ